MLTNDADDSDLDSVSSIIENNKNNFFNSPISYMRLCRWLQVSLVWCKATIFLLIPTDVYHKINSQEYDCFINVEILKKMLCRLCVS